MTGDPLMARRLPTDGAQRLAGESRFADVSHFHGLDRLPLAWDR